MNIVMAAVVHCYVGCNPGSPDLQAIHVLECDTVTGEARIVQSVKGVQGTTYFQLDADGKWLYAAVRERNGLSASSAAVRFPVGPEGRLGAMERLAGLPAEPPCHISLTPDGRRILCASYTSATAVSLNVDGSDLRSYVFPDDAMGPNARRQKKAYAHFTFCTPPGRPTRAGVVDLGCDRIRFFDPATLAVDPSLEIRADPGDGPRHAAWSLDGRFLFVLNELSSTILSYAFDGSKFTRVGKVSMLPEGLDRREADGSSPSSKAAAIKLTADGKLLMASNRGHDSIAFYSVDCATGALSLRNIQKLRGSFPRDFELMPGERFMVVGHKMSDEVQVYAFDREKCSLAPVGSPIPCWRPLCFKFGR